MTHIRVDPVTRVQGQAVVDILLDDQGEVREAWLQVGPFRDFERFCVGRLAEEMPVLTARICGICTQSHQLASVKALDDLFGVTPPPAARKIRELMHLTSLVADHTTHFFALGGPDFLLEPDAPPEERNLLGVVRALGPEMGRQVLACRARNHQVIRILGGRGIHPVAAVPGGWSKPVRPEERVMVEQAARENVDFALRALEIFQQRALDHKVHHHLITREHCLRLHCMGAVDAQQDMDLVDGELRVVDPDGQQVARFAAREHAQHLAEQSLPWTAMKVLHLRALGWKGLVDGVDNGLYCSTPLARLNVADGIPTPLAQEHRKRLLWSFGGRTVHGRYVPVHHQLANHWARLVEMLYAAERMLELSRDPEILSLEVRVLPRGPVRTDGVAAVQAPRGTLIHHYQVDPRGVITGVTILAPTTHNHAPMALSIKRTAQRLIHGGHAPPQLLNQVEMAIRLYDPCLSCATHALPGQMPLTIRLFRGPDTVVQTLTREAGPHGAPS